ncbi:MAG: sigma 54-interacting transcriptional regulator [Myxococcota bacterium]|nr:sigma 54-interacting transcriptional regulator [Myxococcota bacterium]
MPAKPPQQQHGSGGGGVLVAVGETAFGAYTLPPKQKVTLGRSDDNDVSINDPSMSREHAVIHFGADDISIEDLGSTNGTRVREPAQWTPDLDPREIAASERQLERGERVRLVSGAIVMLGTVMLMFQARPTRGRPRRIWPRALFEERVEEECARAAREKRTFALVRIRLTGATTPTATIDIDKQLVNARPNAGPQHIAEDILANETRAGDVIAADEAGEYDVLMCPAAAADVEDLVGRLEEQFKLRGMSVEVGHALYPRDGRSGDALLARAAKGGTPEIDLPHQIIVRDPQMLALHQLIDRVAPSDVTVLLLGETGVGKEVIADTLHQKSRRAKGPLVRINCAALPEGLLESELFGHERGAFTGADKAKAGHFESAQGGTIFLDEVGEIPLSTQVKLLRVLEERKVLRLGARTPTVVDARIIAATNRELEQEVAAGRFRQDLFFRLNVFPLDIPPLRERTAEIGPLATAFIASMCEQMSRRTNPRLDPSALAALQSYAWPGNIRELRNIMHRAVLLTQGDIISESHLPLERMGRTLSASTPERPLPLVLADEAGERPSRARTLPTKPPPIPAAAAAHANLKDDVEQMERDRIVAALDECAGNQTRTATLLGITRRVLLNRLDRYGIPRPRK